jgi:hypothetical protein
MVGLEDGVRGGGMGSLHYLKFFLSIYLTSHPTFIFPSSLSLSLTKPTNTTAANYYYK